MTPLFEKPVWRLVGDRGALVEYGDSITPEINRKVRSMAMAIGKEHPRGIVEVIPTYRSLLIIYDPMETDVSHLQGELESLEAHLDRLDIPPPRLVEIPVAYGGDFGPDIGFVAGFNELTVDEVVEIHSAAIYQIYMIGFTPGFPFLGGLSEQLHTPRLETPRALVPAGSVGIANNQTGIYPVASPGGWRLIGKTPLTLFVPSRRHPFLYEAGDLIKFVPITVEEYHAVAARGDG